MIDLLVAGGGPAGLVTALHAAAAGLEVHVVEPRSGPIDKACGEGLMPGAVRSLHALGLDPVGVPLPGIRYVQGDTAVTADFPDGYGLGVRRTRLHTLLREAVADAGVTVVSGSVRSLTQHGDAVEAAGVRARYLVGADGLHSRVRQLVEPRPARPPGPRHPRWGFRAHFDVEPWSDHVEVHWSATGEVYVTPIAQRCVGVAVLGERRGTYGEQLREFPELLRRLRGAASGPVRAAGPMRQGVRRRVHDRVLLVGDAAGYLDALTGEGLALAFACSAALVARLVHDDPEGYERDYARISRSYRWLTSALLFAAQHETLRPRVVPAAAHLPFLFRAAVSRLAG